MPSTMSSSVSSDFASSTVMTPSLPTFFIASASMRPISLSPFAEIVPTWAISSLVETFFERLAISATTADTARSMPRRRSIGFMPAATARTPSRTSAWARIVAVVVPSPASVLVRLDLLDHLGAHVLELVGELDLLGDGYPVLGDPRCAVGSFEDHVAALRPERHANRIGQSVDAAQHALARVATQANVFCSHDYCPLLFGDDAHDVGFFHNDQVFAVELDLVARPFAKQHPVAGLHIERMDLAVVAADTRPDSHDFALGRLFACGIRDQDAAGALLDFIDAADHHPVVQWPEFHDNSPSTQASPKPTGSMRA